MAWPPPVLPINRTDATYQQTTHPADHNAANLAVNDLVVKVTAVDTRTTNVGVVVQGACPGAIIPPAGEVEVASMNLPAGSWTVHYNVTIASLTAFTATAKMFGVTTNPRVNTFQAEAHGASNAATTFAVTTLARGPGRVAVNIGAPYAGNNLQAFGDPTNHQLFAVGTAAF